MRRKIVLYELNEVPWRVFDQFRGVAADVAPGAPPARDAPARHLR
jgi:hypothetical protein